MIRKIRRRYLYMAMVVIGITIAVMAVALSICNYYRMINRLDNMLEGVQSHYAEQLENGNDDMPTIREIDEVPYWIMEHSASDDQVILPEGSIPGLEKQVREMAGEMLQQNNPVGFHEGYRYHKAEEDGVTWIYAVRCVRNRQQFRDSVIIQIVIAIIGYTLFSVFMSWISRRMVSPYLEAFALQKRFITNISHDLKTPLTVIKADARILEKQSADNKWVSDIQKQSEKMAGMIEEMLLLARMEEVGKELAWVDFPISDVVEEEAQSFQSVARAKGKELLWNIEPMLSFFGDDRAIRHLVQILLDNAVKYSDENGTIRVRLQEKGSGIHLIVYNTVEHIDRKELPMLTERFYRSDSSRSGDETGHGIGLAAADEIVRIHKGEMSFSTEDEKSLKVTIKLKERKS